MILVGMMSFDREALICDLAETYHIYDYRSVPVGLLSIFAAGLRDNSRIKMKMAGLKISLDTWLSARTVDALSLLVWSKTEDAQKGRNRPKMITELLTKEEQKTDKDVKAFKTPDEFESAWKTITGGC